MLHFVTNAADCPDRKPAIDAIPKRELTARALAEWNTVRPTIGIIPTALFRTENGLEPKNNIIVCLGEVHSTATPPRPRSSPSHPGKHTPHHATTIYHRSHRSACSLVHDVGTIKLCAHDTLHVAPSPRAASVLTPPSHRLSLTRHTRALTNSSTSSRPSARSAHGGSPRRSLTCLCSSRTSADRRLKKCSGSPETLSAPPPQHHLLLCLHAAPQNGPLARQQMRRLLMRRLPAVCSVRHPPRNRTNHCPGHVGNAGARQGQRGRPPSRSSHVTSRSR